MADETAQNNATTNDAPSNNDTNQTNNGSGSNITSQSPSVMIKLTNLIAEGRLDFAAWFIRIYLIVLSVQHIFLGGALG